MSQRLISLFARYPWLAVATIVLMTAISLIGYYDPYLIVVRPVDEEAQPVNRSSEQREPSKAAARKEAKRQAAKAGRVGLFGSDVIMVVACENFFTAENTKSLRAAVQALNALPQVQDIMWMDEAPPINVFGTPRPALPDHRASQARFDAAKHEAINNPMVGGQLLSRDGKTALLLVSIDWFHVRKNEDCTRELERVATDAAKNRALTFSITGALPLELLFKRSTLEEDRKFQYIAYGVVLTLATIIFRGPTAVIITALAPILGIFWTLGCLRFFQMQDNPFNTVVVPILLSLVGFTDGVHMMTQIRKYRSEGLSGKESAIAAMDEVGTACFLTSLTTAIGFGSLGWAHHDIVREFGWCCVLGVVITFIAVISAIPLACSSWLGRSVHQGHSRGLIESNISKLNFMMDWVLSYPKTFTVVGIGLTAICLAIAFQLKPDERLLNAIPNRSTEAQALRRMDLAFGGLETATVKIGWNAEVPDDSPEIIKVNEEVDAILKSESVLGSPLGIVDLINALPGSGRPSEKSSMAELLPPQLKRAFLRIEDREASIVFRLQDIGIANYGPVFKRIEEQLRVVMDKHPNFNAELAGNAIWRWKNLYQIILDLLSSLGSAAIIIFVSLAIAYRSVKIGLISVVPNIFPLALTATGMYLFDSPLEIISVLAFTVCLGIAVDDTIHFLTRYKEERKKCPDNRTAIYRSFTGVGSACIMTTLVLVCGFSTVFWSDTREHHIFASMGGATIAFALIGDLIFLPAMLAVFCSEKPNSKW